MSRFLAIISVMVCASALVARAFAGEIHGRILISKALTK